MVYSVAMIASGALASVFIYTMSEFHRKSAVPQQELTSQVIVRQLLMLLGYLKKSRWVADDMSLVYQLILGLDQMISCGQSEYEQHKLRFGMVC